MIEIDEALQLVLEQTETLPPRQIAVSDSLDLALAEEVQSDIDSPPHDKAMVDGYAIIAADLASGLAELTVLEEVTAGQVPSQVVKSGAATRIMTGAPIPDGADAVVMVEQTELVDGQPPRVRIQDAPPKPGQNIMRRATSLQKGQTVLRGGKTIRPLEIGLLSEVGRDTVAVHPKPKVAVLATGDELVAAGEIPAAGQIRNSNGPMLMAQVSAAGGEPANLGIGRDVEEDLRQRIERGLSHDVLILSGGVSAGVLDLVPKVLAESGVEQVFHKVRLKPGKPLWFGVQRRGDRQTLVFGLPGNPIGSFVCFELFVRPTLDRLAGRNEDSPHRQTARLAATHQQRGNRPTFWPAVLQQDGGQHQAQPLDWKGSADILTLTDANCLIHFPAGDRTFAAGDQVETYLL